MVLVAFFTFSASPAEVKYPYAAIKTRTTETAINTQNIAFAIGHITLLLRELTLVTPMSGNGFAAAKTSLEKIALADHVKKPNKGAARKSKLPVRFFIALIVFIPK
jgi:hypothetical protein